MADTIIEIRQQKKIKLGDAIIAATALLNNFTLVTRNQKDFEKINGINILNPFDG
jgi:predicted nucleic acid-binding protein